MAGPGGGGRSGGGGRGGFSGGGFSGGRGPGGHHHHRPVFRPYYRPYGGWGRPYYHGGGCLSALLAPVVLLVVLICFVIGLLVSGASELASGGVTKYDEMAFQDYANQQYSQIFGETAYEDNILLVFLTAEDAYDYKYIAWVGDHVADEVNALLGDDNTALGLLLDQNISDTNYTYTLTSDFARTIRALENRIDGLHLDSNLYCQEENASAPSKLYNHSSFSINEDTVNQALEKFRAETGLSICIVVADMEAVFEKGLSGTTIVMLVLVVVVTVILVIQVVKRRRKKQAPETAENRNNRHKDPF